ncbi:DcaP family trimeric outer membrane transporter [Solimonas sp. K1W22B-7]|uniref:DcaP family trimeric outer membrane transporter n=1 Tax=Solimonas sp. K1W22B-7 TaxID=2303331 RepID=UPI001F09CAAA|nr:DcaP family trimeric outer membrane transporter [Solimonas sp. K1W22B-7]
MNKTAIAALAAAATIPMAHSPMAQAGDVKLGDTTLSWGGYIKVDALYSRYSDGKVAQGSARDFYVPGAIPVSAGSGDSTAYFDMHAKETRLFLKTATEVEGYKLGSYVEMDFIVNPGAGNERVTNAYNIGLRRAYLTIDNWLIGQDWSTFQNLVALPETLDFVAFPTDGTPFVRQPLVRYTLGGFDVSLENPETTLTSAAGAQVTTDENTAPDAALRYRFALGAGQFSLAGLARQLKQDGAGTDMGYGLSFAGKIPVGRDDIRFTVSGGDGIGRYLAINTVNDAAVAADGDLEAFSAYAAYVAYRHVWSDRWRSTATVSMLRADHDVALTGDTVTKEVNSASINLLYSPVPKITLGAEYRHAEREVESGADGSLDRLQFAAKYAF